MMGWEGTSEGCDVAKEQENQQTHMLKNLANLKRAIKPGVELMTTYHNLYGEDNPCKLEDYQRGADMTMMRGMEL